MTVNRYLFQSPSTNQVQIGRLDPSVKQGETSTKTSTSEEFATLTKSTQTVPPTKTDSKSAVEDVPTTTSTTPLLDVYA